MLNSLIKSRQTSVALLNFVGFLSLVFLSTGKKIDDIHQWNDLLLTGVVFIWWLLGLIAWGQLLSKRETEFSISMGLGAVFFISTTFTLAQLGLLLPQTKWFLAILISLGLMLRGSFLATYRRPPWGVFLFIGMIILLRIAMAMRLLGHGDALYYHLEAPRFWLQEGQVALSPSHPITLLASTWEYLYLWPQLMLTQSPDRGLALAQWFSQWIHVLIGFGGTVLAIFSFTKFVTARTELRLFCTALAIGAGPMIWTAPLAKNDWGATYWLSLSALVLIYSYSKKILNPKDAFLIGLFSALSFVTKFTSVFALLPLLLWILPLLALEKRVKPALSLGIGALVILIPISVRNLSLTGTPFFPVSLSFWPSSVLGPTESSILSSYRYAHILVEVPYVLAQRVLELFALQKPALLSLLPIAAIAFLAKKIRPALPSPSMAMSIYVTSLLSFLLFVFGLKGNAQLRLLGPGLVLLGLSFGASTSWLLSCPPFPFVRRYLIPLLPWLTAIACGLIPLYPLMQLSPQRYQFPHQAVLKDSNGYAKAWLRAHAKKTDLIISDGDNELYYLGGYDIRITDKDPDLDKLLVSSPTPALVAASLRKIDARWFLEGPGFPLRLRKALSLPDQLLSEATVFEKDGQRVIDLRQLLN